MNKVNRFGLSRDIPDPIKREVRQRCGFGCVICGKAVYRYHHFRPPFEEARVHDPGGITLLCGNHHELQRRGLLSTKTIEECNRNPKCLEEGFSYGPFDITGKSPTVILGNMTFIDTPCILEAFGTPLLMVESPEEPRTPFRLSAIFHDESGNEIFRIVHNEWQGPASNWDIECKGPRIIIRQAPRRIALMIRTEPPDRLIIGRLNLFYKGLRIIGGEGKRTKAFLPDGRKWFEAKGHVSFISNAHGIVIE